MNIKTTVAATITGGILLAGCAGAPKAPEFKPLAASFVDSKWDGQRVPSDEVCKKFNSRAGETPAIKLNGLSSTTTNIELSFNDLSASPEFNFGGHGVLNYKVTSNENGEIIIPKAPGQVDTLPENFSIKRDFTSKAWDSGKGYLPPCSGGRGHVYTVDIRAFNEKGELTGDTKLNLGRY